MKANTPTDRWAGRLGEYQGGLEVGGRVGEGSSKPRGLAGLGGLAVGPAALTPPALKLWA